MKYGILISGRPETFGSEEWRNGNRQWFLQFRRKYDSQINQLKEEMSSPSRNETTAANAPVTNSTNDSYGQYLNCPVPVRSGSMNSVDSRSRGSHVIDGSFSGSGKYFCSYE